MRRILLLLYWNIILSFIDHVFQKEDIKEMRIINSCLYVQFLLITFIQKWLYPDKAAPSKTISLWKKGGNISPIFNDEIHMEVHWFIYCHYLINNKWINNNNQLFLSEFHLTMCSMSDSPIPYWTLLNRAIFWLG